MLAGEDRKEGPGLNHGSYTPVKTKKVITLGKKMSTNCSQIIKYIIKI